MPTIPSTLRITPLHPMFGAEVSGAALRRLDDATFHQIELAFDEYSVLVFRGHFLSDDEHVAFSQRFGRLAAAERSSEQGAIGARIIDLSNVDDVGLIPWNDPRMFYQAGNQLWHSDDSFKPIPARASALSAHVVPPQGGETEFASGRVAHEALPAELRHRIEGLIAVHSFGFSRSLLDPGTDLGGDYPPVRHALVRMNPRNGRKAIYIGSHAWYVEGLGIDEGRILLTKLLELTVQPERVYRHCWSEGDLVVWDNRCVLHRGRPWDSARDARVMHRTTVVDNGPTAEPPYVHELRDRQLAGGSPATMTRPPSLERS